MVVEKENLEHGMSISLMDNQKRFQIFYMGNGDLYWKFYDKETRQSSGTFEITKENIKIYSLFDELYNSIKDGNVFKESDSDFMFDDFFDSCEDEDNNLKDTYAYKKLVHGDVITWGCDDFPHEDLTNYVNIYKKDDSYKIEFVINNTEYVGIRFSNSGSFYKPFNCSFMDMYNELCEYDIDDRQIHIEEYLYEKNKVLKR